jgi:hypothetical protein
VPKLGEAVLKSLPPRQNLFLSILQLIFQPSAPLCGRFRCGFVLRLDDHLADVPCVAFGRPSCGRALRFVVDVRWGTHLVEVTCVALGRPTCGRALRCVGAPNIGEAVLKSLPPSQNLFLSILQLVF